MNEKTFRALVEAGAIKRVRVIADGAGEKFVGVSRYSASADGAACECAVSVLDDWQH